MTRPTTTLQRRLAECLKLTRVLENEVLRHVIEDAMFALSESGWIACSERMPRSAENVLFWCGWIQIGYHLDATDNWYGRGDEGFSLRENVTHWMPLPSRPTGNNGSSK